MSYKLIDVKQLKSDLKQCVAEVVFDKVDGERRKMHCTLQARYLPEEYQNTPDTPPPETESNALAVWDVNAKGWRSFRIDRVLSVQALMSDYM